jgi:hypothetical protein
MNKDFLPKSGGMGSSSCRMNTLLIIMLFAAALLQTARTDVQQRFEANRQKEIKHNQIS